MIITISVAGKPWTTNEERKSRHWANRARRTRAWRESFAWKAKPHRAAHGTLSTATITVQPHQSRASLADTAAHNPAAKAAIDGIVDAGLLPDDGPTHLTAITFLAPRRGPDGLTLTIEGA